MPRSTVTGAAVLKPWKSKWHLNKPKLFVDLRHTASCWSFFCTNTLTPFEGAIPHSSYRADPSSICGQSLKLLSSLLQFFLAPFQHSCLPSTSTVTHTHTHSASFSPLSISFSLPSDSRFFLTFPVCLSRSHPGNRISPAMRAWLSDHWSHGINQCTHVSRGHFLFTNFLLDGSTQGVSELYLIADSIVVMDGWQG